MAEFSDIKKRAVEIREKYKIYETEVLGRPWSFTEQTQGLVVDVGELMELVMAKTGTRKYKGTNLDADLSHELADILWAVLVISNELNVDIEKEFLETMNHLDTRIDKQIDREEK